MNTVKEKKKNTTTTTVKNNKYKTEMYKCRLGKYLILNENNCTVHKMY